MATSGGLSVIVHKDLPGGLVITLASVSRVVDGQPEREYRPVAFDKQKKRYLFGPADGAWTATAPFRDLALAHNEYRLEPARLPYDQVDRLGIEVVPAAVRRAEKAVAGAVAMRKVHEAGIEILPRPEVGKPFAFRLTSSDGKPLTSAGLKGKVVLIDCWATWCTPCMAKMPDLKALYARHHADGLEVIGVNFDQDKDRKNTRATIQRLGLPWPEFFVPDDEHGRELWEEATGITGLPRLLLIDRDGILRWDGGAGELKEQVARIFPATSAKGE